MKPLALAPPLLAEIRRHGEEEYPEECCGFLIGRDGPDERRIVEVRRAPNRVESSRERRYVIPPEALRQLEAELEGGPEQLVGIYHSHPDHPARPSTFDRDHAWPWYSYVVLAVESGRSADVGAFELDPDSGEFREVPWVPSTRGVSPPDAGVTESSRAH